jgi:hypothetical protein
MCWNVQSHSKERKRNAFEKPNRNGAERKSKERDVTGMAGPRAPLQNLSFSL